MPRRSPDPRPQIQPQLVTQADFARMTGKARSTISEACRPGGPLASAMVADRVNARHGSALRYRFGQYPTIAELAGALGVDAQEMARDLSDPKYDEAVFVSDEWRRLNGA